MGATGVVPQATIQNLESEVILKSENQTSLTIRADFWIRDAIIELTGNPDFRDSFPDLEELGAAFVLTGGSIGTSVQEYAESNFIPIGDYNIKTLDFRIWIDFPTNTVTRKLNYTSYQDTDQYASYPSLPVEWYRFGGNIGFNPTPSQNYQVQSRIQRRHPFIDYYNASASLNTTPILLPAEWYEIIEWIAVMRGYMENLNFARAGELRTMIYGDPNAKNPKPGLIDTVKTKRQSEAWMQQSMLRPTVNSYCFGSGD